MPAGELQLGKQQFADLSAIVEIGPARLAEVADALAGINLTINRKSIDDVIFGLIGKEPGRHLSRFAFGIATALRQVTPTLQDLLESIASAVSKEAHNEPPLQSWPICEPHVKRIIELPSVTLAAKALDISYDFERVFTAARFLTTLRPVFNAERDAILGAAVVQTLRLEFLTSSGGQDNLSFSLDRSDLEELRRLCVEALKKADVLVEDARLNWKKPTIMMGENL